MPNLRDDALFDLTPKQARFVDEYLCDLNATQAAMRAGYSKRCAGQIGEEILKKPEVAAAVQQGIAQRRMRCNITQDQVVAELAKIAFANIADMLNQRGEVRALDEIGSSTLAAVAAYEETSITARGKKVGVRRRVRLHDKLAALSLLMRHLGMREGRGLGDTDPFAAVIQSVQGTTLQIVPEKRCWRETGGCRRPDTDG